MPGPMGGPHGRSIAKPKNVGKTFSRLLGYLKDYKWQLVFVAFGLVVSAGAGVAGTYLLKPIINHISELLKSGSTDMSAFIGYLVVLAAVYGVGALMNYIVNRMIVNISTATLESVRVDMFTKLEKLPLKYFDSQTHGEIMSRFSNDTDALRDMLRQGLPMLITSGITVVGVLVMMLVLSPLLTLLVLVVFALMLLIVKALGGKSAFYFTKRQKSLATVNGYIEEMIEGQREVKVFCREDSVSETFEQKNEELRQASTSAMTYAMVLMPIMGNLSYALYAAAAAAGAALAIIGRADIGTLAAFLQYTRSFSQPLTQLSQLFNGFISALAGAERIFELIDASPETDEGDVTLVNVEKGDAGNLTEVPCCTNHWAWKRPVGGGYEYIELRGDVRFHDVSFSYDGEVDVLKDVNLFAKPGQKIAFVGSTGAGKTTVTNLINRFYDVQRGSITYDGIDVKQIKKDDLRRSLAMVLQDTHLFTGTVRDNIRYGRLDATDAEVEQAAKLANAHSFIRHLPQGYDTVLTADGANLSQGQRQLLAIARAAVANPPVLILDEATSSIDTRTEALIERGMDRLMKGRTVFVIAHRLSTVRNSNAILVLENGQVIERGDHDGLIEQKGKYYQLYMGMFELS
ncbi:MAG TPA: ABC transporter ATP-binding protein [Eubacteriales bacterium]|nr:ABC transporter ATP-binding protein [Eubacteriales bacterium]